MNKRRVRRTTRRTARPRQQQASKKTDDFTTRVLTVMETMSDAVNNLNDRVAVVEHALTAVGHMVAAVVPPARTVAAPPERQRRTRRSKGRRR